MIPEHVIEVNTSAKTLRFQNQIIRCAIGKEGAIAQKREGDSKTPLGSFPVRGLFYRSDRITLPHLHSSLVAEAITPDMGWCDDASSVMYNKPVTLPFSASHETLWRDDGHYDIIVPLGYNDNPPIPGLGSAIFFHLCEKYDEGTQGCIAIKREDMLFLLPQIHVNMILYIG